ncbi:MAG: tryptophan synthase subunit alpha [Armatimonadota bacterium]|nr:tryptophan synthase subunit alpha [Armatimonadota bacterium]
MSRIADRFALLRQKGEGALVVFITAGDPTPELSEKLVLTIVEAGADIIEVGIPFSDPLADGPTIQASTFRALQQGVTPDSTLQMIARVRRQSDVPLVVMTYFNPVWQMGMERFARQASNSGVDGVIMTDMPPDEAGEWHPVARQYGLDTIFLVAPTSTAERMKLVARMSSGFVYCVSRTGVTGARDDLPEEVPQMLQAMRALTDLPLCVGFGVSRPEHVRAVCRVADGAVVGSAVVSLVAEEADKGEQAVLSAVHRFVRDLKEATGGASRLVV